MRGALLSAFTMVLLRVPTAISAPVEADSLEYRVKAAFLFNFLKFVEWPPSAQSGPLVIGVLGHDPFGDVLDETVRGKVINGRPIEVHRYSRGSVVKDCNILFMGRAESEHMAGVAHAALPTQGVLTVGESPGFLQSGGVINFYLEENRVHFEIKPAAAHAAGLRVSSQLLKLGRAL